MTFLEGGTRDPGPPGQRLLNLLLEPEILRVPGAHNAFAGLLAKQAGFQALYISGAATTMAMGLPDLGVMGLDELCASVRHVRRATDLPLLVDGDVGYGGTLNVMRTVKELEHAGAAAVHIEDQMLPKKCGHLTDKRLVPLDEAAAKIAAARKASDDLVIIARTDAAGVEGLDAAIQRARAYHDAGADMTFPDGLPTVDDFRAFAEGVPGPKMANMADFGRTPQLTGQQFQDLGYDLVIWPASSIRVAAKAMQELYAHIKENDGATGFEDRMMSRVEGYEILGYHDFEALDSSIAQSLVPEHTGDDPQNASGNAERLAGE